jgi:hypothetical protein
MVASADSEPTVEYAKLVVRSTPPLAAYDATAPNFKKFRSKHPIIRYPNQKEADQGRSPLLCVEDVSLSTEQILEREQLIRSVIIIDRTRKKIIRYLVMLQSSLWIPLKNAVSGGKKSKPSA